MVDKPGPTPIQRPHFWDWTRSGLPDIGREVLANAPAADQDPWPLVWFGQLLTADAYERDGALRRLMDKLARLGIIDKTKDETRKCYYRLRVDRDQAQQMWKDYTSLPGWWRNDAR